MEIAENIAELTDNTPLVKLQNDEILDNLDMSLSHAAALSLKYFQNGLYCSEAVFRAFNEVYELGCPEELYKISTAFGAGIGGAKCCCGAVTGCVMALGLIAGRGVNCEPDHPAFTTACELHDTARELHDRFKEKHKAICCRILTKSVTRGSAEHKIICEKYVVDAAQITDDLIRTKLREKMTRGG